MDTSHITEKNEKVRWRAIIAALVLLLVGIGVAVIIVYETHGFRIGGIYYGESARRMNCSGNLESIGLALLMYAGDHDGCFPDDLSNLIEAEYLGSFRFYLCPSAKTDPAPDLATFRAVQHCDFLYFGKGVMTNARDHRVARIIVACDRPGNHRGYCNVLLASSKVTGYAGRSIEAIADKNGLLLPGHNMPMKERTKSMAAPE